MTHTEASSDARRAATGRQRVADVIRVCVFYVFLNVFDFDTAAMVITNEKDSSFLALPHHLLRYTLQASQTISITVTVLERMIKVKMTLIVII